MTNRPQATYERQGRRQQVIYVFPQKHPKSPKGNALPKLVYNVALPKDDAAPIGETHVRGVFEGVRSANLGSLKRLQHPKLHHLRFIGEIWLDETTKRGMMLTSSTRPEIASLSENVVDGGRRTEHNNGPASQIIDASFLDIASNAVSGVDVAADPRSDISPNSPPFHQNLVRTPNSTPALKYTDGKQPSSDFCSTSDLEDFILKQVISRFPSIEVANPLFETFHQHCETNYFYFDSEWFKDLVKSFYATPPASEARVGCDIVCLMLVVLAGASQFAHLNQMQDSSFSDAMTDETPGHVFYRLAHIIMPRAIAMGSLASIQACLIAGIYLLPSDERNTAYVYLGTALRMAIASRMHRNTTEGRSPRLLEIRNRVFWTIYLNEREVSMFLGRPTSISIIDIDIPFPQFRADVDDQNEPEKLQRNIALLHLIKVCNRVSVLTTREARALHFEELQASLFAWSQTYSPEIPSSGTHGFRPAVHLALFFNLAFIYLGQHELTNLVRRYVQNPQAETTSGTAKVSQEMSTVCINAATRIIDLIESLRLRGQLALFSIVDIHSCSSAVTVLILSSVTCPSPETRHKVEIALRCLRHIAAGSRSARNGLRLIEKFQSLVNRITARLCPRKILKADTNSSSEYDHAGAASASETGFQNAPDHSFSKGLDGEELHAITDTIHTYDLQEPTSEWPDSDAEGAPQTSFDYDFPGSDFLLSIEQYGYEDLTMYGFSNITSSMDYEV
ncbi:uncharacterized protein PAC_19667 [Phialocephala subalpina]|uniref:Xylanolytic transcriptional activator regulatory domain-containing protein n=1 Tax=Phialocephala subalpina TaxID=576137 RepID=A0A1L7XXM4_9HELO|nr:uncharacterized protein PAC_19667 [Phialocephala subalpina]